MRSFTRTGRGEAVAVGGLFIALGVAAALAAPTSKNRASTTSPIIHQDPEDDEDRRMRLAESRQVFLDNCLACHSEEMTTRQRLTSKQWKTEVEKMVGWGSPVPKEQVEGLTAFLAEQYSDSAPATPPARMTSEELQAEADRDTLPPSRERQSLGDAANGGALYATNCANCHGANGQGGDLGTNLVEKPILVREAEWDVVVRDSRRRMPGFKAILNQAQRRDILAWLRERRSQP